MNLQQYRECASKTESIPSDISIDINNLTAILQIIEIASNMLDKYKKQMFYKREMSENIINNGLNEINRIVWNHQADTESLTISDQKVIRMLHSMVGTITETGGEIAPLITQLIQTGDTDIVNLKEEYGDVVWYIDRGLDAVGQTIDQCLDVNIEKLSARYPNGFFENIRANVRDLEVERTILEQ